MKYRPKQVILNLALAVPVVLPIAIVSSCAANQANANVDLQSVFDQASFSVSAQLQQKLASEISANDLVWDQAPAHPNIKVTFSDLKANDQIGQLSFNAKLSTGSKTFAAPAQPIIGFKIPDNSNVDANAVASEELNRLITLNNNGQLVKAGLVNQSQIAQWLQTPNSFVTQLNGLSVDLFNYNVNQFNTSPSGTKAEQLKVDFDLVVSFKTGSASATLSTKLTVEPQGETPKPPTTNAGAAQQRELTRINHNWSLKQTNFSDKEILAIKENPNLILRQLDQFVYQQYFQYQISDLKISDVSPGADRNLSFKIKARLWKNISNPLKELVSKEHNFKINIYQAGQKKNPAPSNPDNDQWTINPISEEVNIDFSNANFDFSQILIKKDNQIQFDDFATRQFLIELIKANKLVTIAGKLPSDWSWDNYLDFVDYSQYANQKKEYTLVIFIDYAMSQDLDETLQMTLNLNNVTIDDSNIKEFDYQQEFERFRDHFIKSVKPNVQLDGAAIHGGRDGVYQFANLDEKNFLNFTNQNWPALVKQVNNLVRIEATDVRINYLTNEITFKWQLTGLGAMSAHTWSDSQETTLKLSAPSRPKSQLNFNEYSNVWSFDLANLSKFNINPVMIDRDFLRERMFKLNQNWTWMAREFVTFVRFTFYQAFGDQANDIAMAIVPKNGATKLPFDNLKQNFSNYKVVLKAKLDFGNKAKATFIPFIQIFGVGFNLQEREYQSGDEIKIEIDLESIMTNPDPVQDASEIFPGVGQGVTLGAGLGYYDAIAKWPPRFDIWNAQLGIYQFSLWHNNQQLGSQRNIHRFVSFNTMGLYNFQDLIWPEPNTPNWVSGSFWSGN